MTEIIKPVAWAEEENLYATAGNFSFQFPAFNLKPADAEGDYVSLYSHADMMKVLEGWRQERLALMMAESYILATCEIQVKLRPDTPIPKIEGEE